MHSVRLFFEFYKALFKSKIEYRFNFIMDIIINIFKYFVSFISIWIILNKFDQINGWSYDEVMLLFALNLLTYGIGYTIFHNPMRAMEGMVQTGEFDSILIRPVNPFFHIMMKQYYLGFLTHVAMGIVMLFVCFGRLSLRWDLLTVISFIIIIIGGSLIQSALIIFAGALNLKFIKADALIDILKYKIRQFIDYPISIYSTLIKVILTFIIPYAFVNFYPAEFLLGKKDLLLPDIILQFGSIVIGGVLFFLSYLFFIKLIDRYTSAGS